MTLPDIRSVAGLRGKRVLLRVDLNVPCMKGRVADSFRIERILPTIALLKKEGARVILISHLGRGGASLAPIAAHLKTYLPLAFIPDVVGAHARAAVSSVQPSEIVLLENLRHERGEEANDASFAGALASLAECYVNDAFSVSHRAHASIVGVPKLLPHYAGPLFLEEMERLSAARTPEEKSLAIVGGAKFETKLPLIEKLLAAYGTVVVAGALANDFFKARGFETGTSVVSPAPQERVLSLLQNERLVLPCDVTVSGPSGRAVKLPSEVLADEKILDAGPETTRELARLISGARFILWNGPLGVCEEGFQEQTDKLIEALVSSSATTIVGGGDTLAAISPELRGKFSFVSTAGGAMLKFLLTGTLPGVDALKR